MTLPRPSVRSATMWVADMTSSTGNSATGASAWACRSSAPGPVQASFQIDVLKVVFDQLADPRATVDMRYDLQKEIWRLERSLDGGVIGRLVLVAHGPGRHPHGTIIERTDKRVDFGAQSGLRQFFRKAPKLASPGDRRIIV